MSFRIKTQQKQKTKQKTPHPPVSTAMKNTIQALSWAIFAKLNDVLKNMLIQKTIEYH